MIVRDTRILECWCPICGIGQMEQILQKGFEEQKDVSQMVGESFECKKCKTINVIEDFISIIPQSFMVMSKNDLSKAKQNEDLKNFYDAD